MLRHAAIAFLSLALLTGPGFAQEESQPPPEPPEEQLPEEEPPGELAQEPGQEPPEEPTEEPGEEPTEEPAEEPTEEPTEEPDEGVDEDTAEPQLTPEEQAKVEAARRKREERDAKRDARKAKEEEKAAEKVAKADAQHQEQLARLLQKGYAALEAEEYKNALQSFQSHLDLERGSSFEGRMGLARTQLALGNTAAAVEQALKAVKVAAYDSDKADAFVFAGEATLEARPHDETTAQPLPGTEIYQTTALRYFLRAVGADPEGAREARRRLEEAFPTREDEKTERLYERYFEAVPSGPTLHAKRLAAAYEALISGSASTHLVVAGGITAPVKTSGKRPPYPQEEGAKTVRRRLVAGLLIEADGSVSKAQVLNGIDKKLDRKASEAFLTWTFEPARLPNGVPVPIHYVVAVNAVLEKPGAGGSKGSPDQGDPESDQ